MGAADNWQILLQKCNRTFKICWKEANIQSDDNDPEVIRYVFSFPVFDDIIWNMKVIT